MARCEQGYLCDVCGQEVESIRESDLYLRFVIGELPSRHLLAAPERHLRCNPVNAQFIDAPDFPPVVVEGVIEQDPPVDREKADFLAFEERLHAAQSAEEGEAIVREITRRWPDKAAEPRRALASVFTVRKRMGWVVADPVTGEVKE